MLNIIQNTIGSLARAGFSVIRDGLKMWLPFTKTEPLGVNVVTDGSFNDTSEWIKENGWVVSGGLATRTDVDSFTALQQSCLVSGTTYIVTIVVDSITSGNIFGIRLGTNYILQGGLSVGTHTATGTANSNLLSIMGNTDFAGTISSITIQEYAQETPDTSGNDNNAILKTGKTLVFAGNDSVETSFPTSKDIKTIAFWIYPTHSNTAETLFYFGGSSFGTRFLQLSQLTLKSDSFNNTNFNVYINGVDRGETNIGGDNPTLVINEWQRVVLTSSTGFNTTLNTFNIASKGFGSDGRFNMSDLQIYGAEFATDDIAYDYANPQKLVTDNASSSITLSDLDLYLAMTEGAGSIAYDSSGGTAYNGTILGATYEDAQDRILQLGMISWAKSTPVSDEILLPYNPNNVTQDILGNAVRVKGSGFNLDGTGYGEVEHTTDFDFGAGDFSVSAWVKYSYIAKGSSFNAIYTNGGQVDASNSFSIMSLNPNKVIFLVNGTGCTSTTTFSQEEWVHIVATRNSGTINLYINGNKTPEDTDTNSNTVTSSQNPRIGFDGNTARFYNDLIDDVQVYDRYLTPDEVEQNYKATKSGHNN